jgi:ferredoxin
MDFEERTINGLTIRIDRTLCVGFGDCIELAPEAFEFDGEGIVRFREMAEIVPRERMILACDVCPVDAITVVDTDGRQLVP